MIAVAEQVSKPLGNLANSAVLRAVEEEEQEMKCENIKTCQRRSRSKYRYPQQKQQQQQQQQQRPLTQLHQQQLEQIKTEYLKQQNDVTIDRDTVLKINRLATRRNLHKREHSWPPTASGDSYSDYGNESDGGGCGSGGSHHVGSRTSGVEQQHAQQHVRSSSHDNAIQFDKSVCRRHGIDAIREKFNSPTRIIEPTIGELRLLRQRQQKPNDRTQAVCAQKQTLRKSDRNKSENMTATNIRKSNPHTTRNTNLKKTNTSSLQSMEKDDGKLTSQNEIKEMEHTTTLPIQKGFSAPETKAADLDIGLVEPKRQYFEGLASSKRWHSFENVSIAPGEITKQEKLIKRVPASAHKRQSYSLERGRNAKINKQLHLPPQKPRVTVSDGDHFSSKLQRRAIQLATEIKISYDLDADEHNIQVMTRNEPDSGFLDDEMEGLPLPPTPEVKTKHIIPTNAGQGSGNNSVKATFPESTQTSSEDAKDTISPQIFDDSCIYLRSIDLQDNTLAYIPAAITIVPSPTEEIMQHWREPNKLKANIKDSVENENLMSLAEQKSAKATPEATKQRNDKLQSDSKAEEPKTYVTRLPSTPTGIQLTRQTSNNNKSKGKSQLNNNNNSNCNDNKQNMITTMTSTLASKPTTMIPQETVTGTTHSFQTEIEQQQQQLTKKHNMQKDVSTQQQSTGVYYTDGDYLYGPFRSSSAPSLADISVRPLCVAKGDEGSQMDLNVIQEKTDAETNHHKQDNKNEIATLAAKYEHIQQSITEHLKQIDSYIENAKIALKSSTSQALQPRDIALWPHKANVDDIGREKQNIESPLKEVLRKLSYIMTEVQPHHTSSRNEEECSYMKNMPTENLPVVDQVLMDLGKLATHLRAYETTDDITSIKAILQQLQAKHCLTSAKSSHMHCNVEPPPATAQHATTTNEEILDKAIKEMSNQMRLDDENLTQGNNCRKTQTQTLNKHLSNQSSSSAQHVISVARSSTPVPPPPPPPFPLASNVIHLNKRKPENVCDVVASYEQLSATGKIITPDTLAQPIASLTSTNQQQSHLRELEQHQQHLHQQSEHGVLQLTPKEDRKNLVSGFIATRRHQQQLVDQVIDTVDKAAALENMPASEVNVNEHSTTSAISPESVTISSAGFNEKDVAITQKCIISDSTNAQTFPIEKKANERHIINDSANDIMSDEQFPNDNDKHSSHAINYLKDHESKSKTQQENKSKLTFHPSQPGADTDSDKQVETYKVSYEVRSPYVTRRQISWEDIKMQQASNTATITAHIPHSDNETQMTSPHKTNPKYTVLMPEKNKKNPETVFASEPTVSTTSSHVKMQSTMPLKPRTQSKQECSDMVIAKEQQSPTPLRKYTATLIEPHVPMRAAPPYGMNANENLKASMKRTSSISPMRTDSPKYDYGSSTEIKRESVSKSSAPLYQPRTSSRGTSPFDLSTVNNAGTSISSVRSHKIDSANATNESASPVDANLPERPRTPSNLNLENIEKKEETLGKYITSPAQSRFSPSVTFPIRINIVGASVLMLKKTPPQNNENYYGGDVEDDNMKPCSPIRKYPQPLIEPRIPTRAASPFGLNVIESTRKQRTPSPARAIAKNWHDHAERTDNIKLTYVPQVEGHNVGLLVRTTIETSPSTPAAHYRKQHETQTAVTLIDNSKKLYSHHPCSSNIEKSHQNKTNIDIDRVGADGDAYNDLQNINAVGTSRRGNKRNCDIRVTLTSPTLPSITYQHYKRALERKLSLTSATTTQEIPSEMKDSFANPTDATANTCDGSNREMIASAQQQQQQQQEHQKHHAYELVSPLPTVINRSFDNVSPRPYISIEGYKRVAWPPVSEERIVREFTPQPQPQYQTVPTNNQYEQQQQQQQQQQQRQQQQQPHHQQQSYPSTAVPSIQQQYRAPSYDTHHQQVQNPIQPQYSPLARSNQQPPQFEQQYQQPPWMQSNQRQFQPKPQPYQAPQYQPPLNQYQTISIQTQPNQFATQTNQTYNFNSQPQQQQQTIPSHDQPDHRHLQQQPLQTQDYRSGSPGVITLRKEAPISQTPTPVYTSQPAAVILKGGSNMRGDLKWPPPEYKEAAARENEERRQIAMGPACRPRKTNRDYTAFFAKNALSHHYPSYKVPPGTQHIMAK
ncbi:uncharacterized protein ACN427_004233 isoform 4-T10 [Glossina fuscipes fuscipes]